MRLAFHAFDVGPAQNHMLVATAATLRGHVVTCHEGAALGELELLAANPDVTVTSISSFQNAGEIALGLRAVERGIPWVVLTDTHEAWRRPPAQAHAGKVTAVLVAHPDEVGLAQAWGYSRADFLGYPPLWGRTLRAIPSRDATRAKIKKSRPSQLSVFSSTQTYPLPLAPDDVLVLISGSKLTRITSELLAGAINAGQRMFGERLVVVLRPHPREELTAEETAERRQLWGNVWRADTAAFPSSDFLVNGADLVLTAAGATLLVYAALCQRPAIHYRAPSTEAWDRQQIGKPEWFPIERGAALVAQGLDGITAAMERLTDPGGAEALRVQQTALYPYTHIERAMDDPTDVKIVEFLEREFGRR